MYQDSYDGKLPNLHRCLFLVALLSKVFNLLLLIFARDLVAVQVLLLFLDSLFNDCDLGNDILLLPHVLLSLGLGESCRLFSILELSLHVVVLLGQLLDLLRVLRGIRGLLFLELLHILLQLHDRA